MLNFTFQNPTKIVFGKGSIGDLATLVPEGSRTLMLFGGGSIRRNGIYDQVKAALADRPVVEFGGIEPNPQYATCRRAVDLARDEGIDFLLAVGGGSVIDGTKFISAALRYEGDDPWDLLLDWTRIRSAAPFGTVLTLPATGSEMNGGSVISREETDEKLFFISEHTYPRFSILDPEACFTLPPRQIANGIVDAFVQVLEQYSTYPESAPLQDRQSEAILATLVEEGPKVLADPKSYDAWANVMWCATSALNGVIACGVPQDWASHMIGHELTAFYGVDHGQSLAVTLPGVLRHQRARKLEKLVQYAERVWGITEGSDEARADAAIDRTEEFFRSLGIGTRLEDYGIPREACDRVARRIGERGQPIGEHQDLGANEVREILELRV